MKKTFLVTFETTTRVTADVPEDFNLFTHYDIYNSIINDARNNIIETPHSYLFEENSSVVEDVNSNIQ